MNEFAMHDAASEGDLGRIRQLIEAGVSVDSFNEGYTPLHLGARPVGSTPLILAAIRGHEEVAALLIQAGADVNRSDVLKKTALHKAVLFTSYGVVQILLEKEGLHLSPQDWHGDTPLHCACMHRLHIAIRQLLDAGADSNMKNNRGEAPLRVLLKHDDLAIDDLAIDSIRLFVQKGAILEKSDYECISQNPFFKESILKDVEFCTQSIVNKFHRQSLPTLNSITHLAGRLPKVDSFTLGAQQIDEVRELVKCEIERNTFCNVVKVHPISLGALCVLSLITCQSGKKRAGSPDFGPSPFKKIS